MLVIKHRKVTRISREAEIISIPRGILYIGKLACTFGSIKSLNLEKTNLLINGKRSFSHCRDLIDIIFPSSLKEISEGAFFCCDSHQLISFPPNSNLRKIGDMAFKHCMVLQQFDFPPLLE